MIELSDVHKSFGGVEVLRGISAHIGRGEVVCIVGPWIIAGLLLRRWIVPTTLGAQARLVEIVLGLGGLVITTEVAGVRAKWRRNH